MPEPMGFYTDTTVCIGCKACEVACKQWNQLPSTNGGANTLSGDSYDNTRRLDGMHWRHVKFIEQFAPDRKDGRWVYYSLNRETMDEMGEFLRDVRPGKHAGSCEKACC